MFLFGSDGVEDGAEMGQRGVDGFGLLVSLL